MYKSVSSDGLLTLLERADEHSSEQFRQLLAAGSAIYWWRQAARAADGSIQKQICIEAAQAAELRMRGEPREAEHRRVLQHFAGDRKGAN